MPSSLRSILISGANQGIGASAVKQLAATPDVLVFVGSRKIEAAVESITSLKVHSSSKVVPVQLDVTDEASVQAAVETVKTTLADHGLKELDVLVNNAGIGFGSIEEIYAVNIFGTSCLVKAVRPIILSSISGRIVNVSSETGSLAATLKPDCWWLDNVPSAYTTSKTALNGLTVAWAVEERRKGDGRYVATNGSKGHGNGTADDGARVIVRAALASGGGVEPGSFFNIDGPLPW